MKKSNKMYLLVVVPLLPWVFYFLSSISIEYKWMDYDPTTEIWFSHLAIAGILLTIPITIILTIVYLHRHPLSLGQRRFIYLNLIFWVGVAVFYFAYNIIRDVTGEVEPTRPSAVGEP